MNVMAMRGLDPADEGALRLVNKKIRHEMNELADRIATGSCADWGAYQRLVGIIEGLALAERQLLDVLEIQLRGAE